MLNSIGFVIKSTLSPKVFFYEPWLKATVINWCKRSLRPERQKRE